MEKLKKVLKVLIPLQVDILKVFPDELTTVFFYNVTATILSTTVGFFAVPNASAWKIGLDISLISIVCSVRYPANRCFTLTHKKHFFYACVVH